MTAPPLLFGDFTKDEVVLLLTEKDKGFEFVHQGRRNGVAVKNKTEATRVRETSGVTSGTVCLPELAPAVVVKAGDSSPPCEAGDQSKNSSRLNANAPAFVPGRADYAGSDRETHSLVRHNSPEGHKETSNSIGQGACIDTPVTSSDLVGCVVTGPQSSQSVVATTVQPQATTAPVQHVEGCGTTSQLTVSATHTSAHCVPGPEANPLNAVSATANSGLRDTDSSPVAVSSRTLQAAVPKSWASIVSRSPATSGGSGSVQGSSPGGGPPRTSSSNGDRAPKGTVCENNCTGNGSTNLRESKIHSSSIQAQLSNLGEQLQQITISYDAPAVIPRGLTNVGNWCYVHAPLQALLALPGFHQLLRTLNPYPALSKGGSATPITDSMIQFFHEFVSSAKNADSLGRKVTTKGELVRGDSFKPDCIYQMLQEIKSNFSLKGRQEDAEEFLGCLLDGLHEEMVAARQAVATAAGNEPGDKASVEVAQDAGGEDKWEHVGPKNKSTILRKALLKDSPIREIFGGQLYCSVHRHGTKESVVVEPFFSLQLDLQSEEVRTVQQALDSLVTREVVNMSTGSEAEVEAHRRTTLASLPPVLILHLKRFLYNTSGGGLQKLMKPVEYSADLEISKDLLAPTIKPKVSATQRSYRLWAVVYHHGNTATGGHYTCDAYHASSGGWLHMDDGNLKLVSEDQVLFKSQTGNKLAYLLFYVRTDLLKTRQ